METVELKEISNLFDALIVRNIRNACRLFMTRDRSFIGLWRQLLWWREYSRQINKKKMRCYLVYFNKKAIGYGLVRINDNKVWISGGIFKEYRGKGYGKQLFQKLCNVVDPEPVYLEVLKNNTVAYNLYQRIGFKIIKERNTVITMLLRRGS